MYVFYTTYKFNFNCTFLYSIYGIYYLGFIGGESCVIPAGAKRTDHQTYEEVFIPVSKISKELTIGKELIATGTLDEVIFLFVYTIKYKVIFIFVFKVGQKAFHGITNLNRIQSVVFDAAYNTNENLLVCAPTGAGKTNVALLTIVHQIKQHIRNNEIHKNEFKVKFFTIFFIYYY